MTGEQIIWRFEAETNAKLIDLQKRTRVRAVVDLRAMLGWLLYYYSKESVWWICKKLNINRTVPVFYANKVDELIETEIATMAPAIKIATMLEQRDHEWTLRKPRTLARARERMDDRLRDRDSRVTDSFEAVSMFNELLCRSGQDDP